MSKVTSAPWAGADKLTVKVAVVVPVLPSVTVILLMERFGVAPPAQLFVELELRGNGVAVRKSEALSLVSVQPPAFRKSAMVLVLSVNDDGPLPSEKWLTVGGEPAEQTQ